MNEITDIINNYTSPNNENFHDNELHSTQKQIDSNVKSVQMSMIQIRQILNILNSQFYNSSNSISDNSRISIKMYYELFQTVVKGLKPVENAIQNPNIAVTTSNNKYEKLYFKFIMDFIDLMLNINLPIEVFNPISTYFSPLLVIFMKNLIGEKTNISQEDFCLIAQLNQGSFVIFESVIKKLFSDCFSKVDIINDLIQEEDSNNNDKNKILNDSILELKKSLIWKKKKSKQYQTLLSSVFTIRCELISHKKNKIKLSSLLNDIEICANIGILCDNANKSLNELIKFLNSPDQAISVSTQFDSSDELHSFYEKVNNLQLIELKSLYDEELLSFEYTDEMKSILDNIFDYKENSNLDKVFSLVDLQLYNYHHLHQYENDEDIPKQEDKEADKNEEKSDDLTKRIKDEFDHNLQKMIPPTNYDQIINLFLDFIHTPEIGGELPLTLEKDMMTIQFSEIISVFKKDKLNHPIKTEMDFLNGLFDELSFLVNKIILINASDNSCYDNYQSSLFLRIYIGTIKILLIAKEIYIKSDESFQPIFDAFNELIPPSEVLTKILNIDERFQNLQHASKFLMDETSQFLSNLYKKYNENENDFIAENDKQLNDGKIQFFGLNDTTNKLSFELDIAALILSFIEKHEKFCQYFGCSESSTDIWPEDFFNDETEENIARCDENGINASLSLLTLFKIEGFIFDVNPGFFINWITFNFSTINKRIESIPITEFVPFCDYSDLLGSIINSCSLVELYARNSNSEKFINAAELMKYNVLAVFTVHGVDEAQLTKQVQMCIAESRCNSNMFKKVNVLCHTILIRICGFIQLIEFLKYIKILDPLKITYLPPIEIFNYSIEILKKLTLISKSRCVPDEFRDQIDNVGQRLSFIVAEPETNPRPSLFSQEYDDVISNVLSILNEVRKIINTFDITMIASQVSTYIDELLIYYETQQDENSETNKNFFSYDAFSAIFSLKGQVDEIIFANKLVNSEIAIVKMQLILEKAQKMFPNLDKPLEEFYEIINISYAIFSIKVILNFVYFDMSNYSKNGIVFENWFEGEFDENSIYTKEDEDIDTHFTSLMEYINSVTGSMSDLQNRISNITSEISQQENSNRNNFSMQYVMRNDLLRNVNRSFQSLTKNLKSKLSSIKTRKIGPEVAQLEGECEDLIQQFVSFPNQTQNLANIYKKTGLKILPSSNILVTQFESNSLKNITLKNIAIKEMEKEIEILQDELNKRQFQINQTVDSTFIDSKKKQRERSAEIINVIKEAVINSDENKNNEDEDNDEISVDDPNYEIIQKLRKQLDEFDQENLRLKNEIREIEIHHKPSREDQIDLLMNKSYNFPNPRIADENNETNLSGINKKDGDSLSKQVEELNQSIEKMKKKIQVDKKQGSTEAAFVKLFRDIRPRQFQETLINEDIFKQFTKSTRETADKLMKEWRTLRADLDSFESGV